ncbi:hypothetical protein Rsub_02020 [Raphidocelis subcapitata]|uniref:TPX2 C-terminal domain-containing protein n=1 Tax=Raphidocelis subcapitata TaxID=307507 RepID=A0A2V0NPA2_9CHLO|nr:hypothetical protein Rsub_02020 [Raphidocelis subcapitata]|eukprot:GBF89448.1 hypothetical protein Rsub_02020 [Raphidocelis subcapitata]
MAEIDERFEFDAPRFFDFQTMTSDCSPADAWFDTAPEGPGMRPAGTNEANREPFKAVQPAAGGQQQQQQPSASKQRKDKQPAAADGKPAGGKAEADADADAAAAKPKSNLVSSWGAAPPGGAKRATRAQADAGAAGPSNSKAAATPARLGAGAAGPSTSKAAATPAPAKTGPAVPPPPASSRKRARAQVEPPASKAAATPAPRAAPTAAAPAPAPPGSAGPFAAGPGKARRVSAGQVAPRSEPRVTRSMARTTGLAFTPIPERKAKHFSPPKTRRAATAAKPRTPAHKRGGRAASGSKLRQVLQPKISKPARSTKALTLPEEFELATTKRARSAKDAAAEAQAPAPSPFKSLAEKVLDFQAKTPVRFKTQPKAAAAAAATGGAAGGRGRSKAYNPHQPQCTEAKTPLLHTAARARPSRFKSREEEEEEELQREREAAGRHTRHANPTGEQTARKAPDTARRAPTEPKPFSFAVDRRAESRSRGRASVADGHGAGLGGALEGPRTRLRAAALLGGGAGGSILDGPAPAARGAARPVSAGLLGAGAAAQQQQQQRAPSAERQRPASAGRSRPSLTIPKSPFLRTKTRHHSPPPQREAPKTEFRARPAPTFDSFGAKAVPFVAPREPTHPAPFHLATDDRHRQHEAAQQARLEEHRRMEERRRRVSARPVPVTTEMPAVPPRPAPRDLTVPVPYRLRSEARHAEALATQQEELGREEEERRRAAEFRARPLWSGKPFSVHPSEAPLTVPREPRLKTDARAGGREEFDRAVAGKAQQAEEERRREGELKRRREEEEEREYRRSLRFKARPMPAFEEAPTFFPKPSDKPLTNPKTPNFAKKRSARDG